MIITSEFLKKLSKRKLLLLASYYKLNYNKYCTKAELAELIWKNMLHSPAQFPAREISSEQSREALKAQQEGVSVQVLRAKESSNV